MSPAFFRWLGISSPPDRGAYFVDLWTYRKRKANLDLGEAEEALSREFNRCTRRPWTARRYPEMAAWLKENEQALALAIDASERPRYFFPVVPPRTDKSSPGLLAAPLSGVQTCRGLADGLVARAMLRVGEGRPEPARKDLLACHRLGRLVAQGGTFIEFMLGVVFDRVASEADLVFLACTPLTARQIDAYRGDLQKLPRIPSPADKLDLGERFLLLDTTFVVARGGAKALRSVARVGDKDSRIEDFVTDLVWPGIDWDPALRNGNKWCSRFTAALRIHDRAGRER
jgi:hypothetical protein